MKPERQIQEVVIVVVVIAHSRHAGRLRHEAWSALNVVQGNVLWRPKKEQPNERAGMKRTGQNWTEPMGTESIRREPIGTVPVVEKSGKAC
jgi:hypothetical protein